VEALARRLEEELHLKRRAEREKDAEIAALKRSERDAKEGAAAALEESRRREVEVQNDPFVIFNELVRARGWGAAGQSGGP
jgi:hypothetical protein